MDNLNSIILNEVNLPESIGQEISFLDTVGLPLDKRKYDFFRYGAGVVILYIMKKEYSVEGKYFPLLKIIRNSQKYLISDGNIIDNLNEQGEEQMPIDSLLQTYISNVDRGQSDLRRSIEESEKRTNARSNVIEERMDNRLNRIEDMIAKQNERTDQKFDALSSKFDTKFDSLNTKIDSNNKYISKLSITAMIGIIAMAASIIGIALAVVFKFHS